VITHLCIGRNIETAKVDTLQFCHFEWMISKFIRVYEIWVYETFANFSCILY
jgi:hypothetical protein